MYTTIHFPLNQMISWTALNNNSSLNVHEGGSLGVVRTRLNHCHQKKHTWSSWKQRTPRFCKLHANINVSKTSISDNYSQVRFQESSEKKLLQESMHQLFFPKDEDIVWPSADDKIPIFHLEERVSYKSSNFRSQS